MVSRFTLPGSERCRLGRTDLCERACGGCHGEPRTIRLSAVQPRLGTTQAL